MARMCEKVLRTALFRACVATVFVASSNVSTFAEERLVSEVGDPLEGDDKEREANDLRQLCDMYSRLGKFSEEVEARTKLVALFRSTEGEMNWRTRIEECLLVDARRARDASEQDQARLRNARHHYFTGLKALSGTRPELAATDFARALPVAQEVLGNESAFLADLEFRLGISLNEGKQFADALVILKRAEITVGRVFGKEHPFVAEVLYHMANSYTGLDRTSDAAKAADLAYLIDQQIEYDTKSRAMSCYNFARICNQLSRSEDAELAAEEAMCLTASSHDDVEFFIYLSACQQLAISQSNQTRDRVALETCERALSQLDDHPRSGRFRQSEAELTALSKSLRKD